MVSRVAGPRDGLASSSRGFLTRTRSTSARMPDPFGFTPKHHFGAESMHREWLNTEGLKEIRTEDYQKLVDKWVDATGSFPG